MQAEHILDITRQALKTACLLAAPILLFGLVVGVLTNVFQAVTQISETTLAVVPKILAMMLAFVIFSPWMIDVISDFTTQLFASIPSVIR
jgi:flagellar biosynthesis protein FliQ